MKLIPGFRLGLEKLVKWEGIVQSEKSHGILLIRKRGNHDSSAQEFGQEAPKKHQSLASKKSRYCSLNCWDQRSIACVSSFATRQTWKY